MPRQRRGNSAVGPDRRPQQHGDRASSPTGWALLGGGAHTLTPPFFRPRKRRPP